jgi:hypothetical protein
MSLPAFLGRASIAREPLCAEGACLKLERQCKPFVYLNPCGCSPAAAPAASPKEKPRLAAGPSSLHASPELAIGILLLLAGLLPATLLLLTWLLTRGLVLLAWLLTGGLVLLTRILVGIAHSGSPLLNEARDNPANCHWLRGTTVPWRSFCVTDLSRACFLEPAAKTILYKPFG